MLQHQVSQHNEYEITNKKPHSSLFEMKSLTEKELNKQDSNDECTKKDQVSIKEDFNSEDKSYQIKQLDQQIETMFAQMPEITYLMKFCFIMFGIQAFAGWNAVVSAFDYFSIRYPKESIPDVTFYFPFGVMVGDIICGITFVAQSKVLTVVHRFLHTMVIEVIVIILLCIVAMYYNNMDGFWVSMVLLFIEGWVDCLQTNSFVVIAGSVHPSLNNLFWTYTAFSGLIMNALRFAVLGIFGDDLDSNANIGTLMYFVACAVIFIITIVCFIYFKNSEYYRMSQQVDALKQKKCQLEQEIYAENNNKVKVYEDNQYSGYQKYIVQSYEYIKEFVMITRYSGFLSLFFFISFFETFLIFPGVCVFRKPMFTFLEFSWAVQVMMTAFNLGDFIGKYIGYIEYLHRKYWIYSLVILRISFLPVFILMAKDEGSDVLQDDYFIMCMIFLFSLTNGFITTSLVFIAPKGITDPYIRDKVNFFSNFTMTVGIDLGIVLAIYLGESLPEY